MTQLYQCSKCKDDKPFTKFQMFNGKPGGQCRECKTAYMKAKRESSGIKPKKFSKIEDGKKLCMHCDCMKPLEEFSPMKRGLGGLSAYCKPCFAQHYRQTREVARAATAAYRKRHRARHLAAHRIRMYEYRKKKRVTSDGTATDEFLNGLYATEYCHYCLQFTEEDLRTADHVIALDLGGSHSASNLVMACWTCNCSKRNLTEEEFMKKGLGL